MSLRLRLLGVPTALPQGKHPSREDARPDTMRPPLSALLLSLGIINLIAKKIKPTLCPALTLPPHAGGREF